MIGYFAPSGKFLYSHSFEKLVDAMRCVNYLNGGTGDSPPSFLL